MVVRNEGYRGFGLNLFNRGSVSSVRSTQTAGSRGQSKASRRRRVRFDFDGDSLRLTVHVYQPRSQIEKRQCWHSADDIRRMAMNAEIDCRTFKLANPSFVGCFEKFFASPLAKKESGANAALTRDAFVLALIGREDHPRGLEGRMSSLIHRHSNWTTGTVLRRQGAIKPEALAELCAHLSQCTKDLALAYGAADALKAREDAQSDPGESSLSPP